MPIYKENAQVFIKTRITEKAKRSLYNYLHTADKNVSEYLREALINQLIDDGEDEVAAQILIEKERPKNKGRPVNPRYLQKPFDASMYNRPKKKQSKRPMGDQAITREQYYEDY